MSALVKMGLRKYLIGGGTGESVHVDGFRVMIGAGACLVHDKDDLVELPDSNLIKGKRVLVRLPERCITPSKYEIIVSYNPKLLEYCDVSCPPVVGPYSDNIQLALTVRMPINLAELSHVFELYMLD